MSVAVTSDGRKVASSSLDSVIIVWDTLTGAKVSTMETGPVDAWSVEMNHMNQRKQNYYNTCDQVSDLHSG